MCVCGLCCSLSASTGNTYAREEFRLHKNARAEHVDIFFKEWISYLEQLQTQFRSQEPIGRDLEPTELAQMSSEQRIQLEKLKAEATKFKNSTSSQ